MGGEREFTTPTTTSGGEKIGSLRIHENAGEVHFHDDANKTKVAVPVAIIYDAWEKMRTGRKNRFVYHDQTNHTTLNMKIVSKKGKPSNLQMKVKPTKDAVAKEFNDFDVFIRGRDVSKA